MFQPAALFAAAALAAAPGPAPAGATPLSETTARWARPVEPFRLSRDIYYVGTAEIGVFLIRTPKGLILIDTGLARSADNLLANIRRLGFDPRQVRYILASHGHFDHVGGAAAIKAATGARLVAGAGDAPLMARGGQGDPQFGDAFRYRPARVDVAVRDGDRMGLGGVVLTAHITPGHTRGCTTWTLPTVVEGHAVGALFLCSVTAPGYRLAGNPAYPDALADYRLAFARLSGLKCELFLGAHASFFDLERKRAEMLRTGSARGFIDPEGCRAHIASRQAAVEALAKAQTAP